MRQPKQFFALVAAAIMMLITAGTVWAVETEKIDINTASKKELTQLHRIGPALAERIIRYREEHGLFRTPGDMTKVSGIGARTFEMNKDRIVVGEPDKAVSQDSSLSARERLSVSNTVRVVVGDAEQTAGEDRQTSAESGKVEGRKDSDADKANTKTRAKAPPKRKGRN